MTDATPVFQQYWWAFIGDVLAVSLVAIPLASVVFIAGIKTDAEHPIQTAAIVAVAVYTMGWMVAAGMYA